MKYLVTESQKRAKHEHYLRKKDKVSENNRIARLKLKDWFKSIMDPLSCISCGEAGNECLDLHHIDPLTKDDTVSNLLTHKRSRVRIVAEINKCCVLCSNCHRKHHAGILERDITPADLLNVSLIP